VLSELAQKLGAESVDGPSPHTLDTFAELALEALGDLAGGFIGKGEDAHPTRIDADLVDQEADSLDEAESFSRAWPGEYEERLRIGLDRQALGSGGDARDRTAVDAGGRRISDE